MKKLKQLFQTIALYLLGALIVCLTLLVLIQALYIGITGLFVLFCIGGVACLYYSRSKSQNDP